MPIRRRVLGPIIAAALVLVLPLTGCSTLEEVFRSPTGADVEFGGTTLPADFPQEVPLLEGEVRFGGTLERGGEQYWNVTLATADAAALGTIQTQFQESGFAATPVTETEHGSVVTFSFDVFTAVVLVSAPAEDGTVTVDYTVTRGAVQ